MGHVPLQSVKMCEVTRGYGHLKKIKHWAILEGTVSFTHYERLKTVIENITSVRHGNIYAEAMSQVVWLRRARAASSFLLYGGFLKWGIPEISLNHLKLTKITVDHFSPFKETPITNWVVPYFQTKPSDERFSPGMMRWDHDERAVFARNSPRSLQAPSNLTRPGRWISPQFLHHELCTSYIDWKDWDVNLGMFARSWKSNWRLQSSKRRVRTERQTSYVWLFDSLFDLQDLSQPMKEGFTGPDTCNHNVYLAAIASSFAHLCRTMLVSSRVLIDVYCMSS